MMHREVLKKFGQLPSKVQKKVYETIRKFQEDSTQRSINLEKLHNVRDPKVRSIRVGDDYRAIVIAPQRGEIFLLMYVDHHDEAYQWCKNKQFEAHGALGSLQVFDVHEAESALPPDQKSKASTPEQTQPYILDQFSDEDLFQAGVPQPLVPAIRVVRNDQMFEQLADYLPPDAKEVLYNLACGLSLNESLEAALGSTDSPTVVPSDPGDFSHLTEALSRDLVLVEGDEHLREILSEDIEEWRVFLHPCQRRLVEWNVSGPMKINGAAGTGKTVALMHRAVWLAQQMEPHEKLLVTTYTTNLSVTINGLLEKMAPEHHKRIEVVSLHQMARQICFKKQWRGKIAEETDKEQIWESVLSHSAHHAFDGTPEALKEEYNQVVDRMGIDSEEDYLTTIRTGRKKMGRKQRRAWWKIFADFQRELVKRNLLTFEGVVHQARLVLEQGHFPQYRHVLVDELQDFGLEALRLIAALSPISKELSNPLCVVGDGHQRLYGNIAIPLSRAGIGVVGRSRRLKINYRTSEQIRNYAHGLLSGLNVDDLDGSTVDTTGDRSVFQGNEPVVVHCTDHQQMAHALEKWIQGLQNENFGLHEICVTPSIPEVVTALESAGIRTLELKPRQRDPGREEEGVRYGTKKRIKGLEFKAVALLMEEGAQEKAEHFANYVAATRAQQQLLVLKI